MTSFCVDVSQIIDSKKIICLLQNFTYAQHKNQNQYDYSSSIKIICSTDNIFNKRVMNCYLKISYQNKHKKYRFQKDKPINFQQIRRELSPSPNSSLQSVLYLIIANNALNGSQQPSLLKLNQQSLSLYLKNVVFQQHQTIKIRIIEQQIKIKEDVNVSDDKSDSFAIPLSIQRNRSKSQELSLETQKFVIQTDQIQVTQEFLCNSNIEFAEKAIKPSQFDWIYQDLQNNQRRYKQLQFKKRLTNIPAIYQKIRAIIKEE